MATSPLGLNIPPSPNSLESLLRQNHYASEFPTINRDPQARIGGKLIRCGESAAPGKLGFSSPVPGLRRDRWILQPKFPLESPYQW